MKIALYHVTESCLCVISHADILHHVFDPARIVVNLLLHLTLVLLQVGEALLQQQVLLFLGSDRRIVRVTCQLQFGDDVGHIVLVHCFKIVTHLFNLSTVEFRLLLVLLQLVVRIRELSLKVRTDHVSFSIIR